MRDLIVFGVIFGLLPVCIMRPYVGVLLYSWIGYMNPHRMGWGGAFDYPFAKLVAIVTLCGFLLSLAMRRERLSLGLERETLLLVLLWVLFLATTFSAIRPDLAWPELLEISKILLMTFLTIALITDAKRLRLLILVIALSIGFYGAKGGVFALASGGQYMVYGPPRSFIGDNTSLGVALTMVLPVLFFQARVETERRIKLLLQMVFALSLLGTLFTYSRGAFLGLLVVVVCIFLRLSTKFKVAVLLVAMIAAPAALTMLPQKWINRVETLRTYQQDGSANARLVAWETAWRLAKDRPLTGGGFQIIDDVAVAKRYNPEFHAKTVGVHSVYFEVMAENGLVTFGVFAALMLSCLWTLRSIRRSLQPLGPHPFVQYTYMLQASILAYGISGMFLEFASFDLYYHLVAIVIALKVLARQEVARLEPTAAPRATIARRTPAIRAAARSRVAVKRRDNSDPSEVHGRLDSQA